MIRGKPKRPLLYKEKRVSAGKVFMMYKFNVFDDTVVESMHRLGKHIDTKALEQNGQTTVVGKFLIKFYMDELPQVWNVLLGDMSIVGTRPVEFGYYQKFDEERKREKGRVKAGITGHFQSHKGRYTYGEQSRLLDKEYADYFHNNPWYKVLWFDVIIILRTFVVVLQAKGI